MRKNSQLMSSREVHSNATSDVHSNGPVYRLEWVCDERP